MKTKRKKSFMDRLMAILNRFVPFPLTWIDCTYWFMAETSFVWPKMDPYMRIYDRRRVGAYGCWIFWFCSFCGADCLWRGSYLTLMHAWVTSCDAYVPDLKKSVLCINTYLWHHIPTLTILYDQDPTENGYTYYWASCDIAMCVERVPVSAFSRCNRPNLAITIGG